MVSKNSKRKIAKNREYIKSIHNLKNSYSLTPKSKRGGIKSRPIKPNIIPIFINKSSLKRINYIHETVNKVYSIRNIRPNLKRFNTKQIKLLFDCINKKTFKDSVEYCNYMHDLKTIFKSNSFMVVSEQSHDFKFISPLIYRGFNQSDYNTALSGNISKLL